MEITFVKTRWRRVLTILATLAAIIVPIILGIMRQWRPQILFIMSGFMGMVTPLALGARIRVKKWWGLLFEQGTIAFFGLYLLHVSVIQGRFLTPVAFVCNGMLSLCVLFLCQAIFANPKKVGYVWTTICWFYGMLNTCIFNFRGCAIILSDITSIQTAINVAGNYQIEITFPMIVATYVYIFVMINIWRSENDVPGLKSAKGRLTALLIAVVMVIYPMVRLQKTSPWIWGFKGPRINGVLMEFLSEIDGLSVEEPENYSETTVEETLDNYDTEHVVSKVSAEDAPHIIVVMSESYSDLSVLGIKTNQPVAPEFEAISQSTLHGYLLASVYGGNTANSEWEMLTGNTMAFMPGGSVPYRQYVQEDHIYSLVSVLKDQNYECVAMHPYLSSGWARTEVYPSMGFDEIYFLDDLPWEDKVRSYISDEAFVEQIIQRFENRSADKKLFLFGITMQNHGGYINPDFESAITLEGLKGEYPKAEQYLGLIHITDNSIRQLIDYFDSVDENVIILFFGDHQPRLEQSLYEELHISDDQLKQLVPFFIWSNYEDLSGEVPVTSINCLSPMLLDIAGLDMPSYFEFILNFQKTVPAVNPLGYYYDGKMRDWDDVDAAIEELINDYQILQYANVFDETANEAPFAQVASIQP